MNIFRLIGDLSHLGALIILLVKIWKSKSCAGLSGKTQILFSMVFTARYIDVFLNFVSYYNTTMKIIFVLCVYLAVYSIYFQYNESYNRAHDTFISSILVFISLVLALNYNAEFTTLEILWTFSIYLEAVAILPQMWMLWKLGKVDGITCGYMYLLGAYRGFYLFNWIYRYNTEGFFDPIVIISGIVQTVLYIVFLFMYFARAEAKRQEFQQMEKVFSIPIDPNSLIRSEKKEKPIIVA